MTIQQAIEKAIEGGWDKLGWPIYEFTQAYGIINGIKLTDEKNNMPVYLSWNDVLASPSFWQCLGNSLGWPEWDDIAHGNWDEMATITHERIEGWKLQWHRFIDHLAKGKSIENYFETL